MNKLYIFLIAFLYIYSTSWSQVVNIENKRVNDGTYGFSGALDMTLSAQRQKDLLVTLHFKPLVQFKFNGKSDFQLKKDANKIDSLIIKGDSVQPTTKPDKNKHMLLLINDIKYTGGNKNTYANFGMIHLRYAYRIKQTAWKWESYYQIQYNQLLLQKVRTIFGSGLRYKIADIPNKSTGENKTGAIRIFTGTSLFYEYEEIKYDFRPMDYNNAVRWSTYLSSYFGFDNFEFSSTTYIQPSLADFKDHRVSGDYSLMVKITEPFSVKLNFSHFYDSKPPETVNKNTFSLSAGFVYKLDKFGLHQLQRKPKKPREKEVFE